ncbi:MAG: hypothetical protein DCC43_13490 [Candidatus Brocadia sp.]|nr:peptide-methionine (R)-S-oxide reductase [Candidatus Brocadia sp.]MCE7912329.1 hypothetical protein [Candidatus Brocadia sp. AMX3]MDG5997918.1 hypothetical protein [Candidatus Brocadia sp.]RIJ92600.1 MAG: hypothetical protein DCC43_13490 [Candidatus Brocadia sp.]
MLAYNRVKTTGKRTVTIVENDSSDLKIKDIIIHGKVMKSDDEWKRILSSEQYKIIRQKGTERPFTGKYHNFINRLIIILTCCSIPRCFIIEVSTHSILCFLDKPQMLYYCPL